MRLNDGAENHVRFQPAAGRTAPDHRLPSGGGAPGTPAKTSAAAAFALVFGVSALLSVLTAILAPVGVALGIILGLAGLKMARRPGVTGRGVAIGGLVLSILAVLIGAALAAGVITVLNDENAVNRLEQQVQDLRDELAE